MLRTQPRETVTMECDASTCGGMYETIFEAAQPGTLLILYSFALRQGEIIDARELKAEERCKAG